MLIMNLTMVYGGGCGGSGWVGGITDVYVVKSTSYIVV